MIIILKICTSTHLPLVPHVCISIVSGNGLLPFRHQAISSAGCRKKISVLQAPLWDHLVLQTILAFLFSRMHTDHDSQAFFAKKWPVFQVKNLTLNKSMVLYECLKFFFFFFFLHFVLWAALAMLTIFRHPVAQYLNHADLLSIGP